MPKRKITLQEAFDVIHQHGLDVEVKGVVDDTPSPINIADSFVIEKEITPPVIQQKKSVKITLYASHTVSCGGFMVGKGEDKHVEGNSIETYGPGVVTVDNDLAQHLLHQDMLARQADERFLDRRMRSYIVMPIRTQNGLVNAGIHVSNDPSFDLSGTLGKLGDNQVFIAG